GRRDTPGRNFLAGLRGETEDAYRTGNTTELVGACVGLRWRVPPDVRRGRGPRAPPRARVEIGGARRGAFVARVPTRPLRLLRALRQRLRPRGRALLLAARCRARDAHFVHSNLYHRRLGLRARTLSRVAR